MKKRAYISGFKEETVSELRSFLDIRIWMHNDPQCTHDVMKLTSLVFPVFNSEEVPFDHKCYEYVYRNLNIFNDIYTRSFPYYERTHHGMLNAFNLLFRYCHWLLISERIEYLVFSNIPHEAVDFVIEKIARYLNIPILMCHQSPFPGRFWVMNDLDDFGKFSQSKVLSSNNDYRLKQEFNWFYMSGGRYQYNIKTMLSDIWTMPRSIPYPFVKYRKAWDYRRIMKRHIRSDIDLDRKYVYFPLHLQPELTTSALGGIYVDQLLALERLSEILPLDWLVYVKENPKQTEMQRDAGFFQRMARLKNVILVPMESDSLALIRSSQFVATITGTAGWEAISLGKKALTFGACWYQYLPGVFRYTPSLTVNEIMSSPAILSSNLEAAVAQLLCMAGCGVVDPEYSILVEGYDARENARQVAGAIQKAINFTE